MDASTKAAYYVCRQDARDISYRLSLTFERLNKLNPTELREMLIDLKVLLTTIDNEINERIERLDGGPT